MYRVYQNGLLKIVTDKWTETDAKFFKDVEIIEDNEHTVDDYTLCDTEYLLSTDPRAIEYKQNTTREIRNSYLSQYIDPIVSNPLRWADMSDTEKQVYVDYRRYLLDYTEQENWWENYPKTIDEWKNNIG